MLEKQSNYKFNLRNRGARQYDSEHQTVNNNNTDSIKLSA